MNFFLVQGPSLTTLSNVPIPHLSSWVILILQTPCSCAQTIVHNLLRDLKAYWFDFGTDSGARHLLPPPPLPPWGQYKIVWLNIYYLTNKQSIQFDLSLYRVCVACACLLLGLCWAPASNGGGPSGAERWLLNSFSLFCASFLDVPCIARAGRDRSLPSLLQHLFARRRALWPGDVLVGLQPPSWHGLENWPAGSLFFRWGEGCTSELMNAALADRNCRLPLELLGTVCAQMTGVRGNLEEWTVIATRAMCNSASFK